VQYVTDLLLNIKEPFIYQLVAVLADQMGFPEIRKQQGLVTNVIREEETSFFAYTGSRVTVVRLQPIKERSARSKSI
jgi:alanyl-tRNA synthetase